MGSHQHDPIPAEIAALSDHQLLALLGVAMPERCFACDRLLSTRKPPVRVDTRDDQTVYVGPECAKHVLKAGPDGWQPPKGGPKLYPLPR